MTYGNYPDLQKVRRALVIKMRHHGDVLLTSPLFTQLKDAIPQAAIDAFIYEDTLPMLDGHPGIDNFVCYDRGWKRLPFFKKVGQELALLRHIRAQGYDLVINLTEGDRGAIAGLISKSPLRVGFERKGKKLFKNAYTHTVKICPGERHTVERQLDVLRCIGIFPSQEQRDLFLHIPEAAKARVTELLAQEEFHPGHYILIHPVSRWRFKALSTQQIAQVIQGLHKRGLPIVLSSGPDAQELAMIAEICQLVKDVPLLNLGGKLSLKELSALIALSKALICVDSVPLHIASATKTPVVVAFGPTSERNWGPWKHPQARVVTADLPCRPCYQDGCGGSKMSDCLFSLPPQRLLSELDALVTSEPLRIQR